MTPLLDFNYVCGRCKGLRFDDAALGGFESVSNYDGESELKFDEDERLRKFRLNYKLKDLYPELPALSKSSAGGCQSCDFIRAAILSKDSRRQIDEIMGVGNTFSLDIELLYWWHAFTDRDVEQQGLSLLEITLLFGPSVLPAAFNDLY
ncbi:hypothetical protein C8A03DRAFT_35108 [Achaetomium macrosporum]|uniref:Uncharacterized protein n=1 Tax=Achaetomium macrosporum TaxID=79813 RepID=A0AAN7C8I9_9PEZI|nr:hypothetical protein C8A03DRAFT_35108 [Achaetomium macrosporum]